MALSTYGNRAVVATGAAAALAPYARQFWNYLQTHGTPFPSRSQIVADSMKRRAAIGRSKPAKRARVVPGYTRSAGYYGRYNDPRSQGELKFHDVDVDDAVVAANGTIAANSINLIPQGTTESERIGRKAIIKNIGWRYALTLGSTATSASTSDVVRVILYLDTQCNGAAATVTDILESDNYQSFNNLSNKGRFRILMDRTHGLSSQSGVGSTAAFGETVVNGTFYKKCALPIEFSSTTGALTEIRSNNLGVLLLSQSGLCIFESKFRLRFTD